MNISIKAVLAATALTVASGQIATADEVSDTLNSALSAYAEGDIQYALEELEFAKQLLSAMKTDALAGFLPEAPAGYEREVSTEGSAGMAMIGGGSVAEATYSNGSDDFTITIMADSPMMAMMGGMIANAGVMGLEVKRVGRQKFAVQDGDLMGLIGGRIMVQASGDDLDFLVEVLKTMDFKTLKNFGQ